MPEHQPPTTGFDPGLTTFEGVRHEQLRHWAPLPLETILQALEEMGDLARQLGTLPGDEGGEPARDDIVQQPPGE